MTNNEIVDHDLSNIFTLSCLMYRSGLLMNPIVCPQSPDDAVGPRQTSSSTFPVIVSKATCFPTLVFSAPHFPSAKLSISSLPERSQYKIMYGIISYFSWVTCSFIPPRVTRLLVPCSSLQVARCRWYCSFRQAFSVHKSDTCCSSSSILPLCLSSNSCWVSMILLSSFKYSTALAGFSVGFSMSLLQCQLFLMYERSGQFRGVQAAFKHNNSAGCAFFASPLFYAFRIRNPPTGTRD